MRLAATNSALDRGGVTAKSAVELSARQPKPWEELLAGIAFAGIAQITREEHRARQGLPTNEPPALSTPEIEFVDAELVPEQEPPVSGPSRHGDEATQPDPTDVPADESAEPPRHIAPPPVSVTYEEAAAIMRASRARVRSPRRVRSGRTR
ncbi:hypothetical protein [Mycobacterium sp.]|uniref:hypothetical protein n=1 Tax=Mycobacterium sp. TaxID=1785 RepID=UPI003F9AAEB3